jgi:hypothetical protein
MSTESGPPAIASANITITISSWTAKGSLPNGRPVYAAQALMSLAEPSSVVSVSDDGNYITVSAPLGTPVQLNFTPAIAAGATIADGATVFLVSLAYLYSLSDPTQANWAQFQNVLIGHSGMFGEDSLEWTYNGTVWQLAASPKTGMTIINLNNQPGVSYTYGFLFQNNAGNLGTWDPGGQNDPTDPSS